MALLKRRAERAGAPLCKAALSQADEAKNIFHQSVTHIDYVNNLIVIKTISGGANAASALVDEISIPDIVGTIAGDDTFLVICRDDKRVPEIIEQFRSLMD